MKSWRWSENEEISRSPKNSYIFHFMLRNTFINFHREWILGLKSEKIRIVINFYIGAKPYIVCSTQNYSFRKNSWTGVFPFQFINFFFLSEHSLSYIFDKILSVPRPMRSNSLTFQVTIVIMSEPGGISLIIDISCTIPESEKSILN